MDLLTPSCRLRPFRPADAPALARHANHRELWLGVSDRIPHPYAESDAEAFMARVVPEAPVTAFAIEVDGEAVGCAGLRLGQDVERVSAEIGYWVGPALWGRGIATDAVRALTGHGFTALGVRRVFGKAFTRNARSVRVLEKAGYVREGTMPRSAIKDGVLLDQVLYGAYDDRWSGTEEPS
jgi:RimJ/RimL family protein N-acetyltransferase